MKQDKNKIEYILRELQIFDLGDETIYLRKHRVGHVERMTNDSRLINHVDGRKVWKTEGENN
jgi:hypothetical protein